MDDVSAADLSVSVKNLATILSGSWFQGYISERTALFFLSQPKYEGEGFVQVAAVRQFEDMEAEEKRKSG